MTTRNFPGATRALLAVALLAMATLAASACSDPAGSATSRAPDTAALDAWLQAHLGEDWSTASTVLVGAGDIGECESSPMQNLDGARRDAARSAAAATARLLDEIPGTVFTLGDDAYPSGSDFDYASCYDPTWGRHLARTRPAAGNHEYETPGAAGFFRYFGARAAPPKGYYGYDVGSWHVVVLNSTIELRGDTAQRRWLESELAAHDADVVCTVAYFHHPRFSSGPHGSEPGLRALWEILYRHGVDVVLDGHDHLYERFAPQDADGRLDATHGIRQLTAGTGGAPHYPTRTRLANSEAVIDDRHGVLALALGAEGYSWAFVETDGTIGDSGSDSCHGLPPRS